MEKIGLVVTTDKKGVFFGYGENKLVDPLTLERCRMCIYWSAETRGVIGLAANGPAEGSRITLAAPSITINGITAVMVASNEAIKKWESGLWTK